MKKLKRILCVLIGHSRICTNCFGYISCARCEEQVGDTLAGAFDARKVVIVGHGCGTCRRNYAELGWRDKLLTPDPQLGNEA